ALRRPRAPGPRSGRPPRGRVGARQAAPPWLHPRGAGPPRRPREGDRPQRPHRDGVPHRHLGPRGPRWGADRLRRRRPPL
ncbi:MAG: KH domain RNA binding protein YlqC, partial [uncultured Nocardioides sp.]